MRNLVKQNACIKTPDKPICIDLILTNCPHSFQNTFEIRLSDFHKLRANHTNFMTKQLQQAIIKRSKLGNDFLKNRNDASQNAYRKQRNLCVTLCEK